METIKNFVKRNFPFLGCFGFVLMVNLYSCTHEPFEPTTNPADTLDILDTIDSLDTNVTSNDTIHVGDCHPDTIYFNRDVLPILEANCVSCHNANLSEKGVRLDNFMNVFNTADVRPGDLDGSDIYEVITEDDVDKRMPYQQDALSAEDIDIIGKWILQGAKNLTCTEPDTTNNDTNTVTPPSFSAVIQPIITTYCATSSGCHATGASGNRPVLETYTQISGSATRIKIRAIDKTPTQMPPLAGSPPEPTTAELDSLKAWIDAGAPNN